jgi:hypothetical protein
MSRQHMHYDPDYSAESASYSGEYQEEPPLPKNYAPHAYRQKLVAPSVNLGITAGQRLALAIVSLSLFVFILLVFLALAFKVDSSGTALYVFVCLFVLSLYSVVAILINLVFNRRD